METKVKKRSAEYLRTGDKITVAVTHEVKINRESAWIRYEATSTVDETEGTEEAKQRVIDHVTKAVLDATLKTADTIMEVVDNAVR